LDTPYSDNERALYEAAASTDKQLVMLPGDRHGIALLDPKTMALVDEFIVKHSAA
jgi:alpha-beta hydrolase superfamily lysophospholipase